MFHNGFVLYFWTREIPVGCRTTGNVTYCSSDAHIYFDSNIYRVEPKECGFAVEIASLSLRRDLYRLSIDDTLLKY